VDLIKGAKAQQINHKIPVKYIISEAFTDPAVETYLSSGDNIIIKLQIDKLVAGI
jgi:hypothetical protein